MKITQRAHKLRCAKGHATWVDGAVVNDCRPYPKCGHTKKGGRRCGLPLFDSGVYRWVEQ